MSEKSVLKSVITSRNFMHATYCKIQLIIIVSQALHSSAASSK